MLITWKHFIVYLIVAVVGSVGGSALFLKFHEESGDMDLGCVFGPVAICIFFLAWPIFLPLALIWGGCHCLLRLAEYIFASLKNSLRG